MAKKSPFYLCQMARSVHRGIHHYGGVSCHSSAVHV